MSDHDHWFIRRGGRCVVCDAPYYVRTAPMPQEQIDEVDLCDKCQERKIYRRPEIPSARLCAVCGLKAIDEFIRGV